MHLQAVGERAAQLPWLWPDAHSLAALSQPLSPATWPILRRDPGALLLAFRHLSLCSSSTAIVPARLMEPRILETALHWFRHDRGHWIDWRQPAVLPLYETALAIAHQARILANLTRCCDATAAWTAGLLAPLGWFAVAALDPFAVAACRSDPAFATDPAGTQQLHWGLDHTAIARRLAHYWQLPDGLRIVVGHTDLPWEAAQPLGADPMLLATVQLAIVLAEQAGHSLGLAGQCDSAELCQRLRIDPVDLLAAQDRFRTVDFAEAFDPEWQDPRPLAELPAAIQACVERRRSEAAPFLNPLERDLDRLHQVLTQLRSGEEARLRHKNLAALAEFAAGASHEINNPLAVISGQSQYLLRSNPAEPQRSALESIVRQTQRIHAILADLMQFARPPRLQRQQVCLAAVLVATVESLQGMAGEFGVTLECLPVETTIWVAGDPRQLQTAIGCLVRNAIEAAGSAREAGAIRGAFEAMELGTGWVRAGIQVTAERAEIFVEDSGRGLTVTEREHMFDPFFSGRSAGRGRGLGLPTAWRLAREHGGDVCLEPAQQGPTRFVLSLPLLEADQASKRMSA